MKDLLIKKQNEIDDIDYDYYRRVAYCKTCHIPDFVLPTAGYYYCAKCGGDEMIFINPIPEWVHKAVKEDNKLKI